MKKKSILLNWPHACLIYFSQPHCTWQDSNALSSEFAADYGVYPPEQLARFLLIFVRLLRLEAFLS
jgi:hypothetical protein